MKKNKLTDIKLTSVDLVNRGANQGAHIALYKSDTSPEASERGMLKKAMDYIKSLLSEEPETITKADIAKEYDGFAGQFCASLDTIIDDAEMDTDAKTEMMRKSIQEFASFMSEAAPYWAGMQSVEKADTLTALIAKAEPAKETEKVEKRKESDVMDVTKLTPEDQKVLKSLLAKMADEEPAKKAPEKPEEVIDEEGKTKKTDGAGVTKSDVPAFVKDAINKSEEFIKAQELKDMKEIAKKYEVLGERAEELGQHLYDLKKSNEDIYKSSIAMLDRQVEAIEKSGIFTEIGKSGARISEGDVIKKAEAKAAEIRKSAPELTAEQAMARAWEENPDLMAEYEATV